MQFIDAPGLREELFPFALTRPVEDIRIGILTIREKWARIAPGDYPYPIPSNLLPSEMHREQIAAGRALIIGGTDNYIRRPWQIFQMNAAALEADFKQLTQGRLSQPLSPSNKISGAGALFIEEGASIEHSIINTSQGSVYIGRNVEVMEGCLLRGPVAVCEGAVVKMGTRVYGATTLGPYSVAGGEIKNSVIFGYSNKGHDGYLGDSVIGEWCNLGAGTSNSNVKNNAGMVQVFDMASSSKIEVGQKCGLLMGDYSRSAINTSFNTGTVIGICCNVFGAGLTPSFIPSFSWGADGQRRYLLQNAIRDIDNWKKMKKQSITAEEISRLHHIFEAVKQ